MRRSSHAFVFLFVLASNLFASDAIDAALLTQRREADQHLQLGQKQAALTGFSANLRQADARPLAVMPDVLAVAVLRRDLGDAAGGGRVLVGQVARLLKQPLDQRTIPAVIHIIGTYGSVAATANYPDLDGLSKNLTETLNTATTPEAQNCLRSALLDVVGWHLRRREPTKAASILRQLHQQLHRPVDERLALLCDDVAQRNGMASLRALSADPQVSETDLIEVLETGLGLLPPPQQIALQQIILADATLDRLRGPNSWMLLHRVFLLSLSSDPTAAKALDVRMRARCTNQTDPQLATIFTTQRLLLGESGAP